MDPATSSSSVQSPGAAATGEPPQGYYAGIRARMHERNAPLQPASPTRASPDTPAARSEPPEIRAPPEPVPDGTDQSARKRHHPATDQALDAKFIRLADIEQAARLHRQSILAEFPQWADEALPPEGLRGLSPSPEPGRLHCCAIFNAESGWKSGLASLCSVRSQEAHLCSHEVQRVRLSGPWGL